MTAEALPNQRPEYLPSAHTEELPPHTPLPDKPQVLWRNKTVHPEGTISLKELLTNLGISSMTYVRRGLGSGVVEKYRGMKPMPLSPEDQRIIRERWTKILEQKERARQAKAVMPSSQRNQLVLENAGFVHHIIRIRGLNPTSLMDRDDMVQEGLLGLLQAAESYDPARGVTLGSYAGNRIRGQILDAQRSLSPITKTEKRDINTVRNFQDNFIKKHGRDPSEQEIAAATGLTPQAVRQAQNNFTRKLPIAASDIADSRDQDTLLDWMAFQNQDTHDSPEESLLMKEESAEKTASNKDLANALATLPQRDREIIRLRYVENLYFVEIGRRFHLSESRISQLHDRSLVKLKSLLQADGHSREQKPQTGPTLNDLCIVLGISRKTFYKHDFHIGLGLRRGKGNRLNAEQQAIIRKRVEEWKNRSRRNGKQLTENGKQQEEDSVTLRDFLAREKISRSTFYRIMSVTGIEPKGKSTGKKGYPPIILTSHEQQIIKQELETKRGKRLPIQRKSIREKQKLTTMQANSIQRILSVFPSFRKITPAQFIDLVKRRDKLVSEYIQQATAPLTPRQRAVILLRLGVADGKPKTLEEVGSQFHTTRENIRQIEEKALRELNKSH